MRGPALTYKRARHLRQTLSTPEVLLWQKLRGGGLDDLQFRRQHPCGAYILDFYCPARRLAVEVDGGGHGHPERLAHDQRRDEWLKTQGVVVLRIAAVAILDRERFEGVLEMIRAAAREAASGSAGARP